MRVENGNMIVLFLILLEVLWDFYDICWGTGKKLLTLLLNDMIKVFYCRYDRKATGI
jgi:bacteriorhodopsin